MRKKIVAGNWKMNLNYAEAMALADTIALTVSSDQKTDVILAPPFIYLQKIVEQIQQNPAIGIAAQNCSDKNSGAFTGEISASMLASIGTDYVIIGHSERRNYFHETNSVLSEKIKRALENSLLPVYCCGETLEERNTKKHLETVREQISTGLSQLSKEQIKECVIAYEPVWAIGTGVNAAPEQIQEMHQYIRNLIKEKSGEEISDSISILYGGSITPQNSKEIFSCEDVDGGLVGGASLKAIDFLKIVETMEKIKLNIEY